MPDSPQRRQRPLLPHPPPLRRARPSARMPQGIIVPSLVCCHFMATKSPSKQRNARPSPPHHARFPLVDILRHHHHARTTAPGTAVTGFTRRKRQHIHTTFRRQPQHLPQGTPHGPHPPAAGKHHLHPAHEVLLHCPNRAMAQPQPLLQNHARAHRRAHRGHNKGTTRAHPTL